MTTSRAQDMPAAALPTQARAPRPVLESLLGIPFTEGNQVDVLRNGEETFPALLAAIAEAGRTIDMLWFAWKRGAIGHRVAGALADRARSGVRVRLLLDGYGSKHVDRTIVAQLRAAGCQVLFCRPLPSSRPTVWNLRTHRRVLVCDETVAFTGGTAIADSWTGNGVRPSDWRDTAFRVRGPVLVLANGAGSTTTLFGPVPLEELLEGDGTALVITEAADGRADIPLPPAAPAGPDEPTPAIEDTGSRVACGAIGGGGA